MSKHTPGPWKCGQYLGQSSWVVHMDVGDRGRGMDIVDGVAGLTPEQRLANARLIAAAPELLAAAQAAKLALDDLLHAKDGRDWWTQRDAAMMLIDAAIAKATGDAT